MASKVINFVAWKDPTLITDICLHFYDKEVDDREKRRKPVTPDIRENRIAENYALVCGNYYVHIH